jgi:hypothetical protein
VACLVGHFAQYVIVLQSAERKAGDLYQLRLHAKVPTASKYHAA